MLSIEECNELLADLRECSRLPAAEKWITRLEAKLPVMVVIPSDTEQVLELSSAKLATIYGDGACSGNPGPGGYGVVFEIPGKNVLEFSGGQSNTTNNQMELMAIITGLKAAVVHLGAGEKLEVVSDSQYVVKGASEWIHGWKKKNFKDVKNPELWKELSGLSDMFKINWNWVRGHTGHPQNERCDELARTAIAKLR